MGEVGKGSAEERSKKMKACAHHSRTTFPRHSLSTSQTKWCILEIILCNTSLFELIFFFFCYNRLKWDTPPILSMEQIQRHTLPGFRTGREKEFKLLTAGFPSQYVHPLDTWHCAVSISSRGHPAVCPRSHNPLRGPMS